MFTKKQQTPLEKSIQKVLDIKNDCFSRIKHLRIILDNYDQKEAKHFFSNNNTQIYYIFFYTFTNLEAALRQKGQKQSKAEYESLLFIFEKILTLLPELIERKWQYRSITMVMKKLLNPGNSFKIRQEGIRLFLIWYQVLGETGDSCIENMFKSLVPGLIPNVPNLYARNSSPQPRIGDHDPLAEYYDISQSAELANAGETGSNAKAAFLTCDNEPLVIAHPSEPKDLTCYFLQCFMDYIVSQISKVCWHDSKEARSRTCFRYLFEKFKSYYLSFIFPSFDPNFSIYSQTLGLPEYRGSDFQHASELLLSCECVVIRWLAKYMRNENVDTAINRRDSYDELPHSQNSATQSSPMLQPVQSVNSSPDYRNEWRDPTPFDYALVRSILYATRSNVNLIHELFRQAFLMPFTQAVTMRKVVSVYKDWIFSDRVFPPFMKEPEERSPPDSIKAGLSAFLRVFIVNGANIFLFHVPPEKPTLLDEQVDMCKRVLNIYRFMVMKLDMNKATWELLLLVMLRVTSLLFPEKVPSRKEDVLGGRLAPAFFQTLIVTWIRANVNVHISATLWEQFQGTLISLIHWEELIREWSKTMETITRVMSRYVYGIHLSDLPLERQVDKRKRSQKINNPTSRMEAKKQSSSEFPEKNTTSSAKPSQQYSPNGPLVNDHLSSHLPSIDAMHNSSKPTLTRSASDSNLTASKRRMSRKKPFGISHSSLSAKNTANLKPLTRKTRSTENFSSNLNESPSSSLSSVGIMRSPSPTPGSGLETSSLKDSPWQIEGNSLGSNNSSLTSAQRSVTAGGSYKGWSPEGSVILWRRMLGILGNVHRIDDPHLHYHVMLCLAKIVEDFIKIRDNMGISIDNNPTPPPPTHIPPLTFFSPWLFETFQMSNQFKKSKVLAYKLICTIALRSKEIPLGTDFLALFYLSIHQALHSQDLEIICKIVENCGVDLFASGLKGASILLLDFIYACDKIVNAKHTKDLKIPQSEALSLLGTLLSLVETCKKMKALDPMSFEPNFVECSNAKQLILKVLLSASKQEQTDLARCVVLNCLGIIMFQEIKNRSTSMSDFYPEIINIFIAETRFNNEYLPRIACDMLKLLADHAQIFLEAYPSIPKQIITGLVGSISNHLTLAWENSSFKDYKNLLLNLLFCLGEWIMSLPKKVLVSHPKESSNEHSLLAIVINVLNRIIFYSKSDSQRNKSHKSSDSFTMIEPNEGLSSEVKHDGNSASNLPKASSIDQTKSSPYFPDESSDDGSSVIKLAAKMLFGHLLYFMDHFPLSSLGPSRISSLINELDDNPFCLKSENHKVDELTSEIFNTPNVLLSIVNKQTIVCFVDLSTDNATTSRQLGTNQGKSDPHIRIIVRDLIGKFTWDCCPAVSSQSKDPSSSLDNYSLHGDDFSGKSHHELDEKEEEEEDPRSRADPLDLLLREIGKCIFTSKKYFPNTPVPALNDNLDQAEENMMALLSNQHYQEMNFIERPLIKQSSRKDSAPLPSLDLSRSRFASAQEHLYFMYCRQLIDQMGFFFWEKRPKIELLCKNDKILRELRNLDLQKCRETHKIAVFYVAEGQEDKNSILLNRTGSEGFERFVAGLGWEIDLETHTGFLGGLQQNKSTGTSAPYFANSFHEVIFHVSTRIPASMDDSDSLRRKLTHLGNDEVHIVWSEHSRDYRRGIIPTEFCDVLIAIYPLQSFPGYHRICVSRKPEVPFFGPLYSGAVIHHSILPDMVRATAINASRAGRIQRSMYQHHFEERARCIETIFKNHKDEKSFEDFSSIAFCPSQNSMNTSAAFARSISSPGTVDQENKILNLGDPNLASRPRKSRPMSASNLEHKLPLKMLPS